MGGSSPVPTHSDPRPFAAATGRAGSSGAPVLLMPRRIPGGVAASLDALSPDALPRLHFVGAVPALRPRLRAAVAERLPRPRWLAHWLLDDVLDKVALLAELAGPALVRVTLENPDAAGHGGFEVAEARLRLVTSYRGPGTEWLAPRFAGASAVPARAAEALRHLDRGDVAVLRGGASGEGAGVFHRARPAAGRATLRLVVDALEPARRRPAETTH